MPATVIELLGELNLVAGAGSGLNYYSFRELEPQRAEIQSQTRRISELQADERTAWDRQVLKLQNALLLYERLKNSLQPNTWWERQAHDAGRDYDFAARLGELQSQLPAGIAAAKARQQGQPFDPAAFDAVVRLARPFQTVARSALPLIVPPAEPAQSRDGWENIGTSLLESLKSGQVSPAVVSYAHMSSAFAQGKPREFNQAVAGHRQWLVERNLSPELNKGVREFFFNQFQPFIKATVIYLVGFLLGCVFWFNRSRPLHRSAALLVGLAFLLHTAGLLFRMLLEGRPPVTNLYSSAIFVGWAAVLLGLGVEWFYRNGIGTATAAFVGLVTQLIAHNLAVGGDTMEMMRAVLDNNFWLATHVIVITLGYAAMFVAGFVAMSSLLLGVFTRWLSSDTARALSRIVYGVVCFATLFSFTGTVLGGIWADQSWGRFWGWDPKENGALLIVLWTAIFLHMRWGKLAGEPAQLAFAVAGSIVTSFSWFGVNMLGVGLHSYGFMDGGFKWLALFMAGQLAIASLGFVPHRFWRSVKSPATRVGVRLEPRREAVGRKSSQWA